MRHAGLALLVVASVAAGLQVACGGDAKTGPEEVSWDRDACERCQMALSDRRFAAQIRLADTLEVVMFDELGCAVNWIEEQQLSHDEVAEVWVRDAQGEGWLDARAVYYRPGQKTPMNFGFVAQREHEEGVVSFQEAREAILKQEHERRHLHPPR